MLLATSWRRSRFLDRPSGSGTGGFVSGWRLDKAAGPAAFRLIRFRSNLSRHGRLRESVSSVSQPPAKPAAQADSSQPREAQGDRRGAHPGVLGAPTRLTHPGGMVGYTAHELRHVCSSLLIASEASEWCVRGRGVATPWATKEERDNCRGVALVDG